MERNVYLYWVGREYKLINLLRKLIYLHSTNGRGYNIHLINENNVKEYIDVPCFFNKLCPAHQADLVRVNVICDRGGIWLDSDTIVMESLDSLFDIFNDKDGFFIKQGNRELCNGIFGSKKQTSLMIQWKNKLNEILNLKNGKITWCEVGGDLLNSFESHEYMNYCLLNGLDTIYPVNWMNCVQEFIDKPYENYKTIIRPYQPLIVLVNTVYKRMEDENLENTPLNYFINKSYENSKII
jgi:hypothetical protein